MSLWYWIIAHTTMIARYVNEVRRMPLITARRRETNCTATCTSIIIHAFHGPKFWRKKAVSSIHASIPNTKLSNTFVFQLTNVCHTIEVAPKEKMT
jgi:hypothetical protein